MLIVHVCLQFESNKFCLFKGDYVIVDPIEEGEKVKAEISFILYKDHVQYLQKQQLWWVRTHAHTQHHALLVSVFICLIATPSRPKGFSEEPPEQDKTDKEQLKEEDDDDVEDASDSEDDESDLFVNTNRCNYQYSESDEEEDDDDDGEENDDEDGQKGEKANGS